MKGITKSKKPIVVSLILVVMAFGALSFMSSTAKAGECTGGCCQANCFFTCCTGNETCGDPGCQVCTACECVFGFADCDDCAG